MERSVAIDSHRNVAKAALLGALVIVAGCGRAGSTTSATTAGRSAVVPTFTTADSLSPSTRRTFTVDPTVLRDDKPVTFSGTGCPHNDLVLAGVSLTSTTPGTFVQTTPAIGGAWSETVSVADSTLLGANDAMAECVRASDHSTVFSYPSVAVNVTTFRRIGVTPSTTVTAGTKLTVTPMSGCPTDVLNSGAAAVIIKRGAYPGQGDGIGPGSVDGVAVHHDGSWLAHVTVPAGTKPGNYEVSSYCVYSRSYTAWYPVVPIVVVAGA